MRKLRGKFGTPGYGGCADVLSYFLYHSEKYNEVKNAGQLSRFDSGVYKSLLRSDLVSIAMFLSGKSVPSKRFC